MTRLDEPVGPGDRFASAYLTAKAHEGDGRCLNCPPEGPCSLHWWALQELEQYPGFHRVRTDPPTDQTT